MRGKTAILCVGAIAASLFFAQAAHADWQFTKWGMSVDEVVAASKGKALEIASTKDVTGKSKPVPRLRMPWKSGRFEFNTQFYFDQKGGLAMVKMDLRKGDQHLLMGSLQSKYGEPVDRMKKPGVIELAVWRTKDEQIN